MGEPCPKALGSPRTRTYTEGEYWHLKLWSELIFLGLYLDPGHLKPYQVHDVDYLRALGSGMLAWDTGMGKSRGLLAMACSLLDDHPDAVIVLVCEQNKIGDDEWGGDLAKLTSLSWARYYGTGRHKILAGPLPQVLLTTYETARADTGSEQDGDGPLTAALAGRKVLIAYDEMPKLADVASGLYQGHQHLVSRTGALVVGLSATGYTRDWDSVYNMFSLICPQVLPDRAAFERLCVLWRNVRGRATFNNEAVLEHLLTPIAPYLIRRRKTDPEVADMFPRMREVTVHTTMTPWQAQLYAAVAAFDSSRPGVGDVLRMVASYPEALLGAEGRTARKVVKTVGAEHLASIRPGKLNPLIRLVRAAVSEGHKTVIFSFFGPTILPLLARDLEPAGVPILLHYGQLSAADRRRALERFRTHDGPAILLSSDAGSRGINLPQACRLIEYEGARTHMVGAQRRNRIHRLDSPHAEVVCATLLADGTIEGQIAHKMLKRNADTDLLNGDLFARGFVTAGQRRQQMGLWGDGPAAA